MSKPYPTDPKPDAPNLWIWVVLAFTILIAAWTTLIIIATNNQPEIIEINPPEQTNP